MLRAVAVLVAAAVVAGCGGGDSGGDIGKRWVASVDAEDWAAACALMIDADRDCAGDLSETFGDRDVRLIRAGGYVDGSRVTDNETLFAVETEAGDIALFEVVDGDGGRRVDLQAIFTR